MKIIKKSAFTLSEVLITLSLIGFLATMTLATIGSSVQQKARLAEFRTAHTKLDNALRTVFEEEGRAPACYDYSAVAWENFGLRLPVSVSSDDAECADFMPRMARSLGAIKTCAAGNFVQCIPANYPVHAIWPSYNTSVIYLLENGMIFITLSSQGNANFLVDVNGRKGPNRWGLDIFPFTIGVTETKTVNGTDKVMNLGIMPPINDIANTDQLKSTSQMMMDSAGFRN